MGNLVNNNKSLLKEVNFRGFFDYLALDLNIDLNLFKYSDYLKLLEFINKDKKIRKFNNFNDKYNFLDLVCYNYNEDKKIKLYYNKQNLLVCVEEGQIYYNILININYFKNYPHFFNYISELEEYLECTYKN